MLEFFGEITPALLLAMIPGIVEFAKELGVTGKASLVLSFVTGVVLAVVFQLNALYPGLSDWIYLVVYSVLFGMTASGYYNLAKRLAGVQ